MSKTIAHEHYDGTTSTGTEVRGWCGHCQCDDCGDLLTDSEIERNQVENADHDGDALWCDECAEDHALTDAEVRRTAEEGAEEDDRRAQDDAWIPPQRSKQ